jgi:hypothetical protein
MDFIDNNLWTPVHTLDGFECCIEYYVNDHGEVKSTKGCIERLLKQSIGRNGYPRVNLTQRIGRKQTITVNVHTLVALAFLPLPQTPPGRKKGCSFVKHIDGDKTNCSVLNLEWGKRIN